MAIRRFLVATLLAGGAVVGGLTAAAPAHAAPAIPCGYSGFYEAYWYNCDSVPHKVHVDVYGGPDNVYVCVDAFQVRDLGWAGVDWGGVIGAEQVGRCPG